jgi:hypothetical protein
VKKVFVYRYCLIISLVIAVFCGNAYALQGSTAANGSNAKAVHDLGITGEGINIGFIAGGNVLATHRAFQDSNGISHAINHDVGGIGFIYNFHDTPMSGIIISRGTSNHPNDVGVAPDAFVHCVRITSLLSQSGYQSAFSELINQQSCRVIVTGVQVPYDPNYPPPDGESNNTKLYDYYADMCDVVFANAAGNNYSNITIFGDCYNGITTGGLEEPFVDNYYRVGDITNPGPTIDGRKKPEVMAPSTNQVAPGYTSSGDSNNYWYTIPGDGATSWAVPHTAGIAALLLEYANQSAEPNDGHNEVIKAVIVNSTFPNIQNRAGNPTYPADPNKTWHFQRGYGRVDALRAFETLSADRIIRNTTVTVPVGWAYENIDSNQTHEYRFAGTKNERFIFTVTWNRKIDKHGSNYDVNLPLFNLDVTVKNPSGDTVFSETDDVNNLQKVELILPADGNYTVLLKNTTSKSRDYGLAFEILPPLTGDFNIDYVVDWSDLSRIALDWLTAEPDTDIIPDGIVNWLDFAEFADNWLKIEPKYYNP